MALKVLITPRVKSPLHDSLNTFQVRYRGKKLDSYKNNWYRQKRLEFEREGEALGE